MGIMEKCDDAPWDVTFPASPIPHPMISFEPCRLQSYSTNMDSGVGVGEDEDGGAVARH